jgi:hypothetical protein
MLPMDRRLDGLQRQSERGDEYKKSLTLLHHTDRTEGNLAERMILCFIEDDSAVSNLKQAENCYAQCDFLFEVVK